MIRRWLALTYYLYALRLAALSHFYFNPLYNEKQVKKQPALWFSECRLLFLPCFQADFALVSLPVSVTAAFLVQAQKYRARQRHQYERQHHGFVVIFLPHLA